MRAYLFLLVSLIAISTLVSAQTQPVCGQQTLYFEHNKTLDLPNYEWLLNYPSGEAQVDESITITNANGPVLIDAYIMPIGSLDDAHVLMKGLRVFRSFHYVSTAVGESRFNFTAFQRFENGTEVVFYSQLTDDINSLTAADYTTYRVSQEDLQLSPTDRLGIKVYGQTTHSSPVTMHFLYQGTTNTSHFESGYFECPEHEDQNSLVPAGLLFAFIGGLIGTIVLSRRGLGK